MTPDDLTATTGVQLPDSPEALWQIIDTAAAKLADTALSASAEHDLAAMVEISERLRRRRAILAHTLTRHTALTGQRLEPVLPAAADAVADGVIGAAHTLVIAEIVNKVPDRLGPDVKADVETQMVEAARTLRPRDLNRVGLHILAHIDPDGRYTDPDDRRQTRTATQPMGRPRHQQPRRPRLTPRHRHPRHPRHRQRQRQR